MFLRRHILALTVLLVPFAASGSSRAQDGGFDALDGIYRYGVWRDGAKIGRETTTVHHEDNALIVDHELDMELKVLAMTTYRHVQRSQETWRGGRMVELIADTVEDDDSATVDAEPIAKGLLIEGAGGRYLAPFATVPSSFWSIALTRASVMLDIESGRLFDFGAVTGADTPLSLNGRDVLARHVSVAVKRGIGRELWYGADGILLRAQFRDAKGRLLDYRFEGREGLANSGAGDSNAGDSNAGDSGVGDSGRPLAPGPGRGDVK